MPGVEAAMALPAGAGMGACGAVCPSCHALSNVDSKLAILGAMPLPVISDAPHVIQLSIAPAFVLAAIGTTLTVLTNRLARVDDHAEKRRAGIVAAGDKQDIGVQTELEVLTRRAGLINASITTAVVCAFLVCSMIVSMFIGSELGIHLDRLVATLFIAAMVSLAATYAIFLIEIYISARTLRADRPLAR